MPGTFSQIYIQTIFAVSSRDNLIQPLWEERLYQYITGIVQNKEQKMLAINGTSNHIHFLIGMRPSCCLSDLIREIKKSSNIFINENKLSKFKFNWQEGFGAFSYSHSNLDNVISYIMNQKSHHKKKTFKEEYVDLLKQSDIFYEDRFLFEWIE
jgi:putative transposase